VCVLTATVSATPQPISPRPLPSAPPLSALPCVYSLALSFSPEILNRFGRATGSRSPGSVENDSEPALAIEFGDTEGHKPQAFRPGLKCFIESGLQHRKDQNTTESVLFLGGIDAFVLACCVDAEHRTHRMSVTKRHDKVLYWQVTGTRVTKRRCCLLDILAGEKSSICSLSSLTGLIDSSQFSRVISSESSSLSTFCLFG
jgi:hypothetical protein